MYLTVKRISRFALCLLGLAGVFFISSCQRMESPAGDLNTSSDSTKSSSETLFPVRYLTQWTHQAQFAGIYMAEKKGFYRNYGLDVTILPGGPDAPAYENLESGKTDFTQLFLITAITRDAENSNLVNLAQVSQKSALMLVGKKSRGLNSIADMKNRSLGLWRSDFRDLPLIFMKQNNLNMSVINIDFTINLFLNDAVDMINVMRYNEYHKVLQAGLDPEELFAVSFSDVGLNIIEDGLYCRRDYFERYPEECKQFAEATMDGWLYAINHQQETIDTVLSIMRRHHIPANRPHQEWMLKEMRNVIMARPNEIGVLRRSDFEAVKKLLTEQDNPVTAQSYESFYPYGK